MDFRRMVLKFDKTSGQLLEEYELTGIDISELRRLFRERETDPMYHSYDVTEYQKEALEKAIGTELELSNYDYCIDVYGER